MNLKFKKIALLIASVFAVIATTSCDADDYKKRYDSYVTNLNENLSSFETNLLQENQDDEIAINTSILEKKLNYVTVYTSNFDKQHKDLIKETIDELNEDLKDVKEDFFTFNLDVDHDYYSSSKYVDNILIENDRTSTVNRTLDTSVPTNVTRSESTSHYDIMDGECGICSNSKITIYTTNIYELHQTVGKGYGALSYYCNTCGERSSEEHLGEKCTHTTTTTCKGTIKRYTTTNYYTEYYCSDCGKSGWFSGTCGRQLSAGGTCSGTGVGSGPIYYKCVACGATYSSSRSGCSVCGNTVYATQDYECSVCGRSLSYSGQKCGATTPASYCSGTCISSESSSSVTRYKCDTCGRSAKYTENGYICGNSVTKTCSGTIIESKTDAGSGNFKGKYAIHFKSTLKRELMKIFGLKDYITENSKNLYIYQKCGGNIVYEYNPCDGELEYHSNLYKCIYCGFGYLTKPSSCKNCKNSGFYLTNGYLCNKCSQFGEGEGSCTRSVLSYHCDSCNYDYTNDKNKYDKKCERTILKTEKTIMDLYAYQRNNGLTDFDKELLWKIYCDESLYEDNTFIELNNLKTVESFYKQENVITSYLSTYTNWLGQSSYLRYYKRKKHNVYFAYDSTLNEMDIKALLLMSEYLNYVFKDINSNYTFRVKDIDGVSKINDDNIVKITKNDTASNDTDERIWKGVCVWKCENYDDYNRLKDITISIRKTFFEEVWANLLGTDNDVENYILSVFGTLLHESGHLFGIDDAYELLDPEVEEEYSLAKKTIMGDTGDVQRLGFGTNDYKILCGMYGDYTEETSSKWHSKFIAFENSGELVYENIVKEHYATHFENLVQD